MGLADCIRGKVNADKAFTADELDRLAEVSGTGQEFDLANSMLDKAQKDRAEVEQAIASLPGVNAPYSDYLASHDNKQAARSADVRHVADTLYKDLKSAQALPDDQARDSTLMTAHVLGQLALELNEMPSAVYKKYKPAFDSVMGIGKGKAEYQPEGRVIRLTESSNLASYIHESAHYYLDIMTAIAKEKTAPDSIKDRIESALMWMGVPEQTGKSRLQTWADMSVEEQRVYHERFATGFERYVLAGETPNKALEKVMQRARAWMKRVHSSRDEMATKYEGAKRYDPTIKNVFDRMLMADQVTEQVAHEQGLDLLFPDEGTAGVSTDRFKEYVDSWSDATYEAVNKVAAKAIQDVKWTHENLGRILKSKTVKATKEIVAKKKEAQAEIDMAKKQLAEARRDLADAQAAETTAAAEPFLRKIELAQQKLKSLVSDTNVEDAQALLEKSNAALEHAKQALKEARSLKSGIDEKTKLRDKALEEVKTAKELLAESKTELRRKKEAQGNEIKVLRKMLKDAKDSAAGVKTRKAEQFVKASTQRLTRAVDALHRVSGEHNSVAAQSLLLQAKTQVKAKREALNLAKKNRVQVEEALSGSKNLKYKTEQIQKAQDLVDAAQTELNAELKNLDEANRVVKEEAYAAEKIAGSQVLAHVTEEMKAKWVQVTERVEQELKQTPVEKARSAMLENPNLRMDLPSVQMSAKQNTKIKLVKLEGLTKTEGLDPEDIAAKFDFTSADELLLKLSEGTLQEKVEAKAREEMFREFGELPSIQSMYDAALVEVSRPAATRFLSNGLSLLMKDVIPASELAKAAANRARDIVGGMTVLELKPAKFQQARARESKNAMRYTSKNQIELAIKAQRNAVLNSAIAAEMQKVKEQIRKDQKRLAKVLTPTAAAARASRFTEQIYNLLLPFNITAAGPGAPGFIRMTPEQVMKARAKSRPLSKFIEDENLKFNFPGIDPVATEAAAAKNFSDMTVDEIRGLADDIKMLDFLGRKDKKVYLAGKAAMREELRTALKAQIEANAGREVGDRGAANSPIEKLGAWADAMGAEVRKAASYFKEFDGGDPNGLFTQVFTFTANEAGNRELQITEGAYHEMKDAYELIRHLLQKDTSFGVARPYYVPEAGISVTYEQAIMFTLYNGTEAGKMKALAGGIPQRKSINFVAERNRFGVRPYDPQPRSLTEEQGQAIINSLPKEAFEFIKAVYKINEGLRPQIAEQELRLNGKEPEWQPGIPISTPFGTIRGGYIHIAYDPVLAPIETMEDMVAQSREGTIGKYRQANTNSGYTKSVTEAKGTPLHLSLSSLDRHIHTVAHRLAWQDWLVNTSKVLDDIEPEVRHYYGPAVVNSLKDWVTAIAKGRSGEYGPIDSAMSYLQAAASVSVLGWKLMSALVQLGGLSISSARIDKKYMAAASSIYLRNPRAATEFANGKSAGMANRSLTARPELMELRERMHRTNHGNLYHDSLFAMLLYMQRVVDDITWRGAYEQRIVGIENKTGQERYLHEQAAINVADSVVAETQGSGLFHTLSAVQRRRGLYRVLTFMANPMLAVYNMNAQEWRNTNFKDWNSVDGFKHVAAFTLKMIKINIIPVLIGMAIRESFRNECHGDPECLAKKYAQEQFGYLMSQNPLTGMAAGFAQEHPTASMPGALMVYERTKKAIEQLAQGEVDRAQLKALNNLVGSFVPYPSGAINNFFEGAADILDGKPDNPWDAVSRLFAGSPRH